MKGHLLVPPPHVYAGLLLLALLCLPPSQQRLPLQHVLVRPSRNLCMCRHMECRRQAAAAFDEDKKDKDKAAPSPQCQTEPSHEAADALHLWKDRTSFADVVTGSEEGATGRRNTATEAAASRDHHDEKSAHRDTHNNNDEQHQRRLSPKKSSKKKHDRDEEDYHGDQWMLCRIPNFPPEVLSRP